MHVADHAEGGCDTGSRVRSIIFRVRASAFRYSVRPPA